MKKIKEFLLMFFIQIILLLFISINSFSQDSTTTKRLDVIEKQLTQYGKDQHVANKISLVSIVCVVGGTLVGIPATPLLVGTSLCDLATLFVSSRANKRLSKK